MSENHGVGRFRRSVALVLISATALTGLAVTSPAPVGAAPTQFAYENVASGGAGFRTGPVLEVGIDPLDAALMPDGRIVTVERQGFLRVVDANTSTIVAGVANVSGVPSDMVLPSDTSLGADVAVGPTGIVYVTALTSGGPFGVTGSILAIDLTARTIDTVAGGGSTPWADGGTASGTYLLPTGISTTPDGRLVFAAGSLSFGIVSAVLALDLSTGVLERLVGGGNQSLVEGLDAAAVGFGFTVPGDAAMSASGDVFFRYAGFAGVWRVDGATNVVSRVIDGAATSLVRADDGQLWYTERTAAEAHVLRRFDLVTGTTSDIASWTGWHSDDDTVAAIRSDGTAIVISRRYRGAMLWAIATDGTITRIAGNGEGDLWQGDGVGLDQAVYPILPGVAPGPDGRIYSVRSGGLGIFDPATGLTSSVVIPGLLTAYSVYTEAEILDFDAAGRVLMRSIVPNGTAPFAAHQIVLVDLVTRTFTVQYGPVANASVNAALLPNGDLLVVDTLAGTTSIVSGAGTTVIADAPASPDRLHVTPNGDVFASGVQASRLVGSTWIPQSFCVDQDGVPAGYVVQDGATLYATRLDASYSFYEVCSIDTSTGVETVVGTTDYLAPGEVDANGYQWVAFDGIDRMRLRTTVSPRVTVQLATAGAPTQQFLVSGAITGVISESTGTLSSDVVAGPVALRITAPSGFGLDAITCDDPDAAVDLATGSIALTAGAGEQILCTAAASGRGTTLSPEIAATSFGSFGITTVVADAPSACGPATSMTFTQNNHTRYSSAGVSVANVQWTIPLPANPSPTYSPTPTPVPIPLGTVAPITVVRTLSSGTVTAVFTPSGAGSYRCFDMENLDTSAVTVLGYPGGTDTDGWWRSVSIPMTVEVTITPDVGLPRRYVGPAVYSFEQTGFVHDGYRPGGAYYRPSYFPNYVNHVVGFTSANLAGTTLPGPLGTGGISVADTLSPGGTLSTPAPTVDEPVSASVTVPAGGSTAISIAPGASTSGSSNSYSLGGRLIRIVAPPGTAASPLEIRFRVNSTEGPTRGAAQPTRNGVFLNACPVGATSWPVACISEVINHPDGDVEIVVRTPAASDWTLEVTGAPPDDPLPPSNVVATLTGTTLEVTWDASPTADAGYLVRVPGTTLARYVAPGEPRTVTFTGVTGVTSASTVEIDTLLDDGATSLVPARGTVVVIVVDATPPTITCPTGVSFLLRATGRTLTAAVSDSGSGVATTTVTVPVATGTAGNRQVFVTATDLAGNTATVECGYQVRYRVDWLTPLGGPDQVRSVVRNTTVPFTFRLTDAAGAPVTGAVVTAPTSVAVACPAGSKPLVVSLPTQASTRSLGNGWWLAGWRATNTWRNTCREVRIALADGTTLTMTLAVV